MPDPSVFSLQEAPIPKPKSGEVLLKSLYVTVDPYMRGRMNPGPSYIEPFKLDEPPTGGVVAKVVESLDPDLKPNDIVVGYLPWSDYNVAKPAELRKLDPALAPVSTALGVLGMPGLTAYFGMLEIGKPKKGETLVVSGAAGAVGMLVGQIGKIYGCKVVGIAGSEEKIGILKNALRFDEAVNYKDNDFPAKLREALPNGVDIYFDNVGGEVTDKVLPLINKHARIVVCGQISAYNAEKSPVGPRPEWLVLTRSALMQGFIVSDFEKRFPEGIEQMSKWLKEGKIQYRETIIKGLENTPRALLGLFRGENIGKQIVKVEE